MKNAVKIMLAAIILMLFCYTCKKADVNSQAIQSSANAKIAQSATFTLSLLPIDSLATSETINLYHNLRSLADSGVMFGQQDALAKGVGWYNGTNQSDIKSLTGEHPMIFGSDLGGYEINLLQNQDAVAFDKVKFYAKKAHAQGGINTFSWHLYNPVDSTQNSKGTAVDSTVRKILTNPVVLNRYKSWLDKIAAFVLDLKDANNRPIPIIFRPFHEHNANWFWWGRSKCTPQEYIDLWRLTVTYLRDVKGVHQFLYAYSPNKFNSSSDYLERYPGDAYVDILGFDAYDSPANHATFSALINTMVTTLQGIATTKDKLFALTETGYQNVAVADWYTGTLLPIIKNKGLSYTMTWRNAGSTYFFVPYPGQTSATDFITFYSDTAIVKPSNILPGNVYQ